MDIKKFEKILLIVFTVLTLLAFLGLFTGGVVATALMESNVKEALIKDSTLDGDILRKEIAMNAFKLFLISIYFIVACIVCLFTINHFERERSFKKGICLSIVNILIGCLPYGIIYLFTLVKERKQING